MQDTLPVFVLCINSHNFINWASVNLGEMVEKIFLVLNSPLAIRYDKMENRVFERILLILLLLKKFSIDVDFTQMFVYVLQCLNITPFDCLQYLFEIPLSLFNMLLQGFYLKWFTAHFAFLNVLYTRYQM